MNWTTITDPVRGTRYTVRRAQPGRPGMRDLRALTAADWARIRRVLARPDTGGYNLDGWLIARAT